MLKLISKENNFSMNVSHQKIITKKYSRMLLLQFQLCFNASSMKRHEFVACSESMLHEIKRWIKHHQNPQFSTEHTTIVRQQYWICHCHTAHSSSEWYNLGYSRFLCIIHSHPINSNVYLFIACCLFYFYRNLLVFSRLSADYVLFEILHAYRFRCIVCLCFICSGKLHYPAEVFWWAIFDTAPNNKWN